jgi:hypothetical protein
VGGPTIVGGKAIVEGVESIPTGFVGGRERSTVGKDIGDTARGVFGGPGSAVGRLRAANKALTAGATPVPARPLQDIVFGALGKTPIPTVRPPVIQATGSGQLGAGEFKQQTLGGLQDVAKDMAAKPNKYIDASAANKTLIVGASPVIATATQLSLDGVTPPEIQSVFDQNKYGALSPNESMELRERARAEGHDVANWESLTPGEKVYKAYNSGAYGLVTLRNAVRAVGATGSAPAGIKAIGDAAFAAFRGDTAEGKSVINGVLEPFEYANEVAERDGLAAGLAVAFRDNPVDFFLIANAALRTTGRVAGVTARTGLVGKVGGRLPGVAGRAARGAEEFARTGKPIIAERSRGEVVEQTPLTPGAFKIEPNRGSVIEQYNAWKNRDTEMRAENADEIAEAESVGRVNDAGVPFKIERKPLQSSIIVGYTGPNILSPIGLKVRQVIAQRNNRFGRAYADRLQSGQASLFTRTQANVSDGVFVEINRVLSEALGRAATDVERQRAAFELTWAGESFKGTPITPGSVADYFRQNIRDMEESAEFKFDPGRKTLRTQIDKWAEQAREWDRIDAAQLDAETVRRIRAVAKPLGDRNELLVAAALGIPTTELKRQNYLRMLIIDPDFEAAARVRKAERNVGKLSPKALIKSQKKIARIAATMREKAKPEGFGAKSRPKSRARFAELRRDLVDELRRAEKAAVVLGDEDLATQYREYRAQLVLARVGAPERAAVLADEVARIGRLEARVEDLPVEARPAYSAAQAVASEVSEAVAAAEAASGALGAARAAAGVKRVDSRIVALAEQALEKARKDYELDLGSDAKSLTPDQVEASRVAVDVAERRLVALREAQDAQVVATEARGVVRGAERRRESAVKEVVRIVESGRPVIETGNLKAALDASEQIAAVRVRKYKDYGYYKLERARGEVLDEFIARVEAADNNAILHLVQKGAIEDISAPTVVQGARALETGPAGRVRKGRLKPSKGGFFALGNEETSKMWQSLMFDTAEFIAAEGWRKKMQELIELTSIKVSVSEQILRNAQRQASQRVKDNPDIDFDAELQNLVLEGLNADSFEFSIGDFHLFNPGAPKAKKPTEKTFKGMIDRNIDPGTAAGLLWREVNDRTIDPNAPGDYYLMPRAVYDSIQKSLADEAFRFRPTSGALSSLSGYNLDRATRAWRTLTLNVLPRTAFANIAGSAILGLQAGAGPRAWYYAWRALTGKTDANGRALPFPKELLQRYYDQFTPEIGVSGRLRNAPESIQIGAAWVAWWMNSMRRLNGMSEDFGRLAVWYSKAYPEALKVANGDGQVLFSRAKRLNDDAMDILDTMASGDPAWTAKNDAWLRQSYDFLGYLHRGGKGASRARIFIPFWQWYLHMLKLTFVTMPVKYPGRALFLQQLGDIGEEYQKTHGVMIPGYGDLIPLHTFETTVENQPQFVTTAVGSSNWYPQGTPAGIIGSGGDPNIAGYIRGSVNPVISNTFLIGLSLGMGEAKEYSDYDGLKAAKNEYGNNIERGFNGDFVNYLANRVGQSAPLSSTIMGMSGRSSNSTLWNLKMKPQRDDTLPSRRVDLVSIFEDPWGPSAPMYLLKAFTGMQFQDVPGIGPYEQARIRKLADYEASNAAREERNIQNIISQIQSGVQSVVQSGTTVSDPRVGR